ncbi:hypothetical protein RRG08_021453 [Elysia crispata]|uniref:Uncharacterized protein n=1 Tax=Elysia crispata TaxID=231223 RepID=A0AAE1CJ92_9GAST|nr:hypothetical protein RRG08_021453 [Elysia crispata]
MMLRLMRFNLLVKHTPGSQLYVADTLGRAYLQDTKTDGETNQKDDAVLKIISTTVTMPATKHRLQEIRDETQRDRNFCKVKNCMQNGCPSPIHN